MKLSHVWRGVRLRTVEVGIDPDQPAHRVAIPAGWSDDAARGFVDLACGEEAPRWDPVRLPDAAERWIRRLVSAGPKPDGFVDAMNRLLLLRQACPDRELWRGNAEKETSFVLNLAAFAETGAGLDELALESAVGWCLAASLDVPGGCRSLRLADLDGMLARLGIDYDSEAGRQTAVRTVKLIRGAMGDAHTHIAMSHAGPAEALLGVETAGLAPAFSLTGADGGLTLAARARLSSLMLSPERALARTLAGEPPLQIAGREAHRAMHEALARLLDASVALASASPRPVADRINQRRMLPARSKGFTQKVTVSGHRLFLRTAEYTDGSLGEISITLAGREGALARGLADAVASAISVALQYGVPLESFVETFAHGRFGAAGIVEGDPGIISASSPLDYVVRALSEAYLGRHLADPPSEAGEEAPLLPLGLIGETGMPAGRMRQRALRLVSPA